VLDHPDAELAFGLIAPLGVDLEGFVSRFEDELRAFGYSAEILRLSTFLKRVEPRDGSWRLAEGPEGARIDSYMTAGDQFRRGSGRNDALALMAASDIANRRSTEEPVAKRKARILVSLKHPAEVLSLREIYDVGFFAIGLYTPEAERLRYLTEVRRVSAADARRLLGRDEEEPLPHGQQARDAFQLADVFVRVDRNIDMNAGIARFLELVFGNPTVTPTASEHAMFLAYAASLRSGALGRQVGAVIVSAEGDVLAVGANDAPKFGGGQYWPGPDDRRDARQGRDSNATQCEEIVKDITDKLEKAGLVTVGDPERRLAVEQAIRESSLVDITEYGRDVHAEMEALLSSARSGATIRGGKIYTTTFPCHNCAKHIVGAGIARVVFVEPYPKSKAVELHADALTFEESESTTKVLLEPFVGIGPRRYLDLFSLRLGSGWPLDRKAGMMVAPWRREGARPRVQMRPVAYLEKERAVQRLVDSLLQHGNQGEAP
jgi:deoxycytidylate deaminase